MDRNDFGTPPTDYDRHGHRQRAALFDGRNYIGVIGFGNLRDGVAVHGSDLNDQPSNSVGTYRNQRSNRII